MILTKELFEKGKSSNGGWNNQQLKCLGIVNPTRGWKHEIIGKDFPEEAIRMFIDLKDAHFKYKHEQGGLLKKKVMQKMGIIKFTPTFGNIPYKDQYLHPNWQKMRTHVLNRDKFTCVNCRSDNKTLHAHHLKYNKAGYIWGVPHWYIVTLCEDCHSEEHNRDLRAK